jgi:hypothetical protein
MGASLAPLIQHLVPDIFHHPDLIPVFGDYIAYAQIDDYLGAKEGSIRNNKNRGAFSKTSHLPN